MNPNYTIERWTRDQHTAIEMRKTIQLAVPQAFVGDEDSTLAFFEKATESYEKGSWVAKQGNQVLGHLLMMRSPSHQVASILGAVRPEFQRKGIGNALWKALISGLDHYPQVQKLQARIFASSVSGDTFLTQLGFRPIERTCWLKRNLDLPVPQDLQEKVKQLSQHSIRIISGLDYQNIREDWAYAWWSMETEAIKDIPSKLGVMQFSFTEWREMLRPPFCYAERILIAVEGIEPIGILKLGKLEGNKINVDLSAVAASHRRRGVSTALKLEAIEFARRANAQIITTQNHSQNQAMIQSNLRFGFVEDDALVDYLYEQLS